MSIRFKPEKGLGPAQVRDRFTVQNIPQRALFLEDQPAGRRWQPVQVDANHSVLDGLCALRDPKDDFALIGIVPALASQYPETRRLAIEARQGGRHIRRMHEQGTVRLRNLCPFELLQRRQGAPGRLVKPLEQYSPRGQGTGTPAPS